MKIVSSELIVKEEEKVKAEELKAVEPSNAKEIIQANVRENESKKLRRAD